MDALKQAWQRLSLNQRLLVGSLGGALFIAVVLSFLWAARPEYTVLYANLDPASAAQISERLRSRGIGYELSQEGRTILVSVDEVYQARLDLAVDGLPEVSEVGYEIFDTSRFGVTDFVQRVNYHRALEGEIARTIQSINEVRSARVHLVIPEASVFADEDQSPTASVVLQLKGDLSSRQVQGIVSLVASSVEGLKTADVTVLDGFGELLSRPQETDLAAETGSRFEMKTEVEDYIRAKVTTLLESVLGTERVVAQVDADLDFEQIDRTVERYDSDNPAVRSEERRRDTTGGVRNETTVTNYEISRTMERIVSPVGGVRKLTVAVLVDGNYVSTGDGAEEYVPRTPEEIERLTGIVETAVGFDAERGDVVEVQNVPFNNDVVEMAGVATLGPFPGVGSDVWTEVLNRGGQLLVIVILALLLRSFYRRVSEAYLGHTAVAAARHQRELELMSVPSEDERYLHLQQEMVRLVRERPEDMSRLVRAWLKED